MMNMETSCGTDARNDDNIDCNDKQSSNDEKYNNGIDCYDCLPVALLLPIVNLLYATKADN